MHLQRMIGLICVVVVVVVDVVVAILLQPFSWSFSILWCVVWYAIVKPYPKFTQCFFTFNIEYFHLASYQNLAKFSNIIIIVILISTEQLNVLQNYALQCNFCAYRHKWGQTESRHFLMHENHQIIYLHRLHVIATLLVMCFCHTRAHTHKRNHCFSQFRR